MSIKKKHLALKVLIFIFILAGFTGAYFYHYLSSFSNKPSTAGEGKITLKAVEKDKPVNILIMGVDVGDPKSKSKDDPKRTDTIMLANYNPNTKEFNIVSIPRDTLIKINGKNTKINSAHAIGGVDYLIKSVEKLLDIDINFYGKVDYEGFRKIIDAIGGVDITIKNTMKYDDPSQNLSINFKKGETVHLNGKKAEEFFRWRKNNDGTGLADGDLGRIENQHLFIEKVIEKLKSPSIITKIPQIMSIVPKYSETNMDATNIAKYGLTIVNTNKENIKMTTLKGDGAYIDEISYFLYDEKQNSDILKVLHNESKTESNDTINFDKDKIKIQILNGTNRNGLADSVSKILKEKGYNNIVVGNSKTTKNSRIQINDTIDKKSIEVIKKDFNISNIIYNEQKDKNFDIIFVIGNDF